MRLWLVAVLQGFAAESPHFFPEDASSDQTEQAAASEVIGHAGPDSLAGRTAAIMMGSTETTFYVIAVYFGAAGVRKTRHAIPAALCADLTGFLMAAWTARWFFGG